MSGDIKLISDDILRHDKHCRICNGNNIEIALLLNDTPIEDQYLAHQINQPAYPLQLALCLDCGYVFLPHIINPKVSYDDYAYQSSITVGLLEHYDAYAEEIVRNFAIPAGSFVVDLGSNDGSMLSSFKKLGHKILGVEPADGVASIANDRGLHTINDFFCQDVVRKVLVEHGPAMVVTANYMYANIDDVISFTKLVKSMLGDDGLFVVQTGYHPDQMKGGMFDYIYHEHFSYFTVEVIQFIFDKCGLELIDAKRTVPKGGSVRVVGQLKGGSRVVSDSVSQLIDYEQLSGVKKINFYQLFEKNILSIKANLQETLKKLVRDGRRIVGFGASHSTTTLLYYFEIAEYLQYLVDDNPMKHGTFSPGHHLNVFSVERLPEDKPDYVLVLAWQHQANIITRHAQLINNEMRWIIPLPEIKIL